jgi:hypothetical protein
VPGSQGSPPPGDIRQRAHEILSRAEFERHESLAHRIFSWIGDLLNQISFGAGGGPGVLGNVISLLVLTGVVVLVVFLVRAVLRQQRVPKLDGRDDLTIEVEDGRPATDWRSDAERFEAAGQWREAMRARYGELVRSLVEERVLDDVPGRTTGEYRTAFVLIRPERADAFVELTALFETVWYGGVETDARDNARFRELAALARTREPVAV